MKRIGARLRRRFAAALVFSLLGTQCLFAYQPENNFWTERRKATQKKSSLLMAALPVGRGVPDSLVVQFPAIQNLNPVVSQSLSRSVPKGFLKDRTKLLSALSTAHGTVRKVSLGQHYSPTGPVVIHIQDVHMNSEAQWNIRETVRSLMGSDQVNLVALEGATEDIQLQPFVDYPHRKPVELAADYLLKENKISGPIHAALTAHGQLPRFLGIDDAVHYQANIQAYRDSAPKLEITRQEIKTIQAEVEKQKGRDFSPALRSFDRQVQAYRTGQVSLGDYVQTLVRAKVSLPSNSICTFLQALQMERILDFHQVETQRARLVEQLTGKLAPNEIQSLLTQTVAHRSGELGYADFYAYLKNICQEKGIRLSDYPAMDAYVRYVLLAEEINAESLLEELAALEKSSYARLAVTPEEKALVERSRQTNLMEKLVDFSLTPHEWRDYQSTGPHEGRLDLSSFESFYQQAQARDDAMSKNVMGALSSGPPSSVTVLVTGGFHAERMADQLTRQGVTVLSYVPKISKIDTAQGSSYLSVFTQEKTPLEKLFQGENLFLAQPPFSDASRHKIVFWSWAREKWVGKGHISPKVAAELDRLRANPGLVVSNLVYKRGKLYLRLENTEVPIIDKTGEMTINFEKDVTRLAPIPLWPRLKVVVLEFPHFALARVSALFSSFVFKGHREANKTVNLLVLRLVGMERIARTMDFGFFVGLIFAVTVAWWLLPVFWIGLYAVAHFAQVSLFPEAPAMGGKGTNDNNAALRNRVQYYYIWTNLLERIKNGTASEITNDLGAFFERKNHVGEIPFEITEALIGKLSSATDAQLEKWGNMFGLSFGNEEPLPPAVLDGVTGFILRNREQENNLVSFFRGIQGGVGQGKRLPLKVSECVVGQLILYSEKTLESAAALLATGFEVSQAMEISDKAVSGIITLFPDAKGYGRELLERALVSALNKTETPSAPIISGMESFIANADPFVVKEWVGVQLRSKAQRFHPEIVRAVLQRAEKREKSLVEPLFSFLAAAVGRGDGELNDVVDRISSLFTSETDEKKELIVDGLARGFEKGTILPREITEKIVAVFTTGGGKEALFPYVKLLATGIAGRERGSESSIDAIVKCIKETDLDSITVAMQGLESVFTGEKHVPEELYGAALARYATCPDAIKENVALTLAYGLNGVENISPDQLLLINRYLNESSPQRVQELMAKVLSDAIERVSTVPPQVLVGVLSLMEKADQETLAHLTQGFVVGLKKTETLPEELKTRFAAFLDSYHEDSLGFVASGVAAGLGKDRSPLPWLLDLVIGKIKDSPDADFVVFVNGLGYGFRKEPYFPPELIVPIMKRLLVLDQSSFRNQMFSINDLELLTSGIVKSDKIDPQILMEIALYFTTPGRANGESVECLAAGFSKATEIPPEATSAVAQWIERMSPAELGVFISRWVDPLQVGQSVPEMMLASLKKRLLKLSFDDRRELANSLGSRPQKKELNSMAEIVLVSLAEKLKTAESFDLKCLTNIFSILLPTAKGVPDSVLAAVFEKIELSPEEPDSWVPQSLLAGVAGYAARQQGAINPRDPIVARINERLRVLLPGPIRMAENSYFLRAALDGSDSLEKALTSYQTALKVAETLPEGVRYDVRSVVCRAGRKGSLLSTKAWEALSNSERIGSLGSVLSAEDYVDIAEISIETNGGKWRSLEAAYLANKFDWPARFRDHFEEGAKLFGVPAMLRFVGRDRTPEVLEDERHESIFKRVELVESLFSPEERELFSHHVFDQIWKDNSINENGENARSQFISLLGGISALGPDWRNFLTEESFEDKIAKQTSHELITQGQALQSWRQFKRVRGLLSKNQILISSIASFKDGTLEGAMIYRYLSYLRRHPGMSDFKALNELVLALKENDETYFARKDSHSLLLHEELKPSHYFEFKDVGIDLTPQLLARGLILGKLDEIQSFHPFELDYYPDIGFTSEIQVLPGKSRVELFCRSKFIDQPSLKEALFTALNNFEGNQEINGAARNSVANARNWLENGMKGTPPGGFNNRSLAEIITFDNLLKAGMRVNNERYRLRIMAKSDPQAAVIGNENVNCMGFGTGKKIGYDFNPNSVMFVLSKEVEDLDGSSRERILASSVITLDRQVPVNVSEIRAAVEEGLRRGIRGEISLGRKMGEGFLEVVSPDAIAAADNIEGAPSFYFKPDFEKIVEEGYKKFWETYFRAFPLSPGGRPFNRRRIPVGMANSKFLKQLPQVDNFDFPAALVSYSDNVMAAAGEIRLGMGSIPLADSPLMKKGMFVRSLLAEDILEASYVENHVFGGAAGQQVSLGVQNQMIAAISNGAIQGRDREFLGTGLFVRGKLVGYILAYAGVDSKTGEEEIYVSDYAVMPAYRNTVASGSLMNQFLARVQNHATFRSERGKGTVMSFDSLTGDTGSFRLLRPGENKASRSKWLQRWGLTVLREMPQGDRIFVKMAVTPVGSIPTISPEIKDGGILWFLGAKNHPERAWWVESLALVFSGIVLVLVGQDLSQFGVDLSSWGGILSPIGLAMGGDVPWLLRVLGGLFIGAHVIEYVYYRLFRTGLSPPLKNSAFSMLIAFPLFLIPFLDFSSLNSLLVAIVIKPLWHRTVNEWNSGHWHTIVSQPNSNRSTSWRILVWDPMREQLKWFVVIIVGGTYLLASNLVLFLGGGLPLFFFSLVVFGVFLTKIVVPIFLAWEHESYSEEERKALLPIAEKISYWTLGAFILTYFALCPWGLNGIAETGQFFSFIASPAAKTFVLSAIAGYVAGVVKHVMHNARTFDSLVGRPFKRTLLPLSRTVASNRAKKMVMPNQRYIMEEMSSSQRTDLLSGYYESARKILAPQTRDTREKAIAVLLKKIKINAPAFFNDYKEILSTPARLATEPHLLEYLLNLGIFAPLNANPFGFRDPKIQEGRRWIDLNPSGWDGMSYLGTDIYWGQAEDIKENRWLFSHGVGILPATMREEALSHYLNILLKRQSLYSGGSITVDPNEETKEMFDKCLDALFGRDVRLVNSINSAAKILAKAYRIKERGQVVRYLKDSAYTQLIHDLGSGGGASIGQGMNSLSDRLWVPTRKEVIDAVVLKNSLLLPRKATSPEEKESSQETPEKEARPAPSSSENGVPSQIAANLSGLRDALQFLAQQHEFSLALIMFTQAIETYYIQNDSRFPVHQGTVLLLTREKIHPILFPQMILNRPPEETVNWAIQLIDTMLKNNFVSHNAREREINRLREEQEKQRRKTIVEMHLERRESTLPTTTPSALEESPNPTLPRVNPVAEPTEVFPVEEETSSPKNAVSSFEEAKLEYDHLLSISIPEGDPNSPGRYSYAEDLAAGINKIEKIGETLSLEPSERETIVGFSEIVRALLLEALGEMGPTSLAGILKKVAKSLHLTEGQTGFLAAYGKFSGPAGVPSLQAIAQEMSKGNDEVQELRASFLTLNKKFDFPLGNENSDVIPDQWEEGHGKGDGNAKVMVRSTFVDPSFARKIPTDVRLKKIFASCLTGVEEQVRSGVMLDVRSESHRRAGIYHTDASGYDFFAIVQERGIVVLWFGPKGETHTRGGKTDNAFDKKNLRRAEALQNNSVIPTPLPDGYFVNGNGSDSNGTLRSFGLGVPGILSPLLASVLIGMASLSMGVPYAPGLFLVLFSGGITLALGQGWLDPVIHFVKEIFRKGFISNPPARLAEILVLADRGERSIAAQEIIALLNETSPPLDVESIGGPGSLNNLAAFTQSPIFSDPDFRNQFSTEMGRVFPMGFPLGRARRAVGGLALDGTTPVGPGGLAADVDMKTKKGFLAVVTREMLKDLPKRVGSFEKAAQGKPVYWVAEDVLVFQTLQKIRPSANVMIRPRLVERERAFVVVSGKTLERVVSSNRFLQDFAIALPKGTQVDMEGVDAASVLRSAVFFFLDELLSGMKVDFNTLRTIDTVARRIASAA